MAWRGSTGRSLPSVLSRLLRVVVTLLGVALLVFVVLRMIPGNQITASLGVDSADLSPEQLDALRAYYGLDQSPLSQFLTWLTSVLRGDLGTSLRDGQSVGELTLRALPVTLELTLLSILLGGAAGVTLGVLSARRELSVLDVTLQSSSLFWLAVPSFVVGAMLVTLVSSSLGFFPNARGYAAPWEDLGLNLQQMAMPVFVLATEFAAIITRATRSAYLDVQSEPFVRTARAKGLSEPAVSRRHVLRNAWIPITTIAGIQFGYLLGGAVIVEQIFALPGIGRQLFTGVQQRDYILVQSTVLIIAIGFVATNWLVDTLHRRLDPRGRQ